jgi:hypothetical protein
LSHPASAGRPRFDIAEIVRQHRARLEAEVHLSAAQRRVLSAIELCRTAALGGHLDACRACGYEHPSYNSCRNRHCPKFQSLVLEKWIAARAERLLPVPHFHLVFTLPSELRPLAKALPRLVYDALFSAASETLLELGRTRLAATLAVTMVLHTWRRDLGFHPHAHALVTAGGLALDASRWLASSTKYLFPVQVMRALLRGKMLHALRRAYATGELERFDELHDPEAFDRLMARLARKDWHVYAKKPFGAVEHVLAYLGRYTHRVAFSNSRLLDVSEQAITFRTKNGRTATLSPVELLRRFVQHVLPDRFKKIRHFGLYAGRAVDGSLQIARDLLLPTLSADAPTPTPVLSWTERLYLLTGRDVDHCPRCGALLEHIALPRPAARDPPARRAA